MDDVIEGRIVKALKKQPMHISGISKETGLNRLTVSKYCAVLEAKRKIKQANMAQLKIFFVNPELKANGR